VSAIPPPGVSRGHLPCSSSKGSISWGRPLAPARGERHQLASSMVECRSVLSPRGQMRETGCTPALVHRYGLFPDRNTLCPGTKDSLKPVSHTAQGRAVPHPAPSRGIRASAWPVPTGRASPSGKGVLSLHEGDTSRLGKGDDAHAPFCPRTRGTPGRMSGRRQSPGVLSRHEGRPRIGPFPDGGRGRFCPGTRGALSTSPGSPFPPAGRRRLPPSRSLCLRERRRQRVQTGN